jgi:hypothetical protein
MKSLLWLNVATGPPLSDKVWSVVMNWFKNMYTNLSWKSK